MYFKWSTSNWFLQIVNRQTAIKTEIFFFYLNVNTVLIKAKENY